jgi:hypothetical protein
MQRKSTFSTAQFGVYSTTGEEVRSLRHARPASLYLALTNKLSSLLQLARFDASLRAIYMQYNVYIGGISCYNNAYKDAE